MLKNPRFTPSTRIVELTPDKRYEFLPGKDEDDDMGLQPSIVVVYDEKAGNGRLPGRIRLCGKNPVAFQ
jgi:hypothetical protein